MSAIDSTPSLIDLNISLPFRGQAKVESEAAALLVAEYNRGNRRLRKNLVAYLVKQIRHGEWRDDHPQPIVFSDHNRLIDGQHRLQAIAESGVTVRANVALGVDDGLREYLDTGISRQLEDRVEFVPDLAENRRVAQIVNQFMALQTNSHGGWKPTPGEAHDIFVAHEESIRFVAGVMASKARGITTAPVMVALAEMYERNQEKAESFAENLMSPDGTCQPARRLREYLISKSVRGHTGGGQARIVSYMRSVSAMKAALEGRTIAALRNGSWK